MKFLKYTIKNFRSFTDLQTLWLGIPQVGKLGSGVTYVVGANNSGKTTLLESLWLHGGIPIRDPEKRNEGPEFCLFGEDGKIKRKLKLIRQESNTLEEDPELGTEDMFEMITSRRHWNSLTGYDGPSINVISQSKNLANTRGNTQNIDTAGILKAIEKDSKKYGEFIKLVQRVIPEFTKWAVGYDENYYIKYISSDGIEHKTDFLGDGVISVIRILAHLFERQDCSLIIDEPELSLHPLAQKRLAKVLGEYSEHRQIIISTHSPYFIDWEYIKNGAVLNKVSKTNDVNSQIFTIKDYSKYEKIVKAGNWQQPFLLDVVSKEIFFSENILFLEGQEDVGLLRKYISEDDICIFGYGVRGYCNFEIVLQLADDLGIRRACVVLDSPVDDSKKPNENNLKSKLEKDYGTTYKILQWNKNDIRDKEKYESEAKDGYFTSEGILKSDSEIDDFKDKIDSIKAYFEE